MKKYTLNTLFILTLLLNLASCTKQNIAKQEPTPKAPSLYCEVNYEGKTFKMSNCNFTWTINSNKDTVIECNNGKELFYLRSVKYSNTHPWVTTFDNDQYEKGRLNEVPTFIEYKMTNDTMKGNCTFGNCTASFSFLKSE